MNDRQKQLYEDAMRRYKRIDKALNQAQAFERYRMSLARRLAVGIDIDCELALSGMSKSKGEIVRIVLAMRKRADE